MERRAEDDLRAVVDAIHGAVLRGEKPSQTQMEDMGVPDAKGRSIPRNRVRAAIARAETAGHLQRMDLPEDERRGARKDYLMPVGMRARGGYSANRAAIPPTHRGGMGQEDGGAAGIHIPPSIFPIDGGGI
jgi:hypothetical protein